MAAIEEQMPDLERQLSITQLITDQKRNGKPAALYNDDQQISQFITKGDVKDDIKVKVEDESINGFDSNRSAADHEVKPEVKDEEGTPKIEDGSVEALHRKWDLWGSAIVGREWMLVQEEVEKKCKQKLTQLRNATKQYRLGAECGQNYVNQYSSNTQALNKLQHNEDKDKKRHLSHKFSLGTTPEFKWSGTIFGSEQDLIDCLRGCLQHMEQSISSHLFHPHWVAMRKRWLSLVALCSAPMQFSRCIVWLVAAIKPVVFQAVWHEALGHVRLARVTALEREERRRQEKRDKKELETQQLDDYRNTLPVRFTKIPKHQVRAGFDCFKIVNVIKE